MEWMLMPYRRYADFNGRSRRQEYWMFILFNILVFAALAIVLLSILGGAGIFSGGQAAAAMLTAMPGFWVVVGLLGLFWLFSLVPSAAVTVRRLHDRDLSGWWYVGYFAASLVPFLNFIAGIALLVVLFLDGTRGPNRFGPDPKDLSQADVFA